MNNIITIDKIEKDGAVYFTFSGEEIQDILEDISGSDEIGLMYAFNKTFVR